MGFSTVGTPVVPEVEGTPVISAGHRETKILERIKALWKELVDTFGAYRISDLESVVDTAEEFLKRSLYPYVRKHTHLLVSSVNASAPSLDNL